MIWTYDPCGLFYNAGLFEQKGWTVPTTWDEMWELGEKAKAEGKLLYSLIQQLDILMFFLSVIKRNCRCDAYTNVMKYDTKQHNLLKLKKHLK